jgi:serine/threonine-protein kinase
MQPPSQQILTCPTCGAALEETFGGGGSCMFCLLQAGIGSEEETVHDSTQHTLGGGTRFGAYEIDCHADGSLCELGRGAMGVTYRATDTSLQRKVALKIIKTDIAERSADARERFVREARAAAALRHEHIATVYQFGMRLETGQYFYAMELIEGETLDDRVRRKGPLDARSTIGIAEQVTSALAAAEKEGLVHRDLKPANLMLVKVDDPEAMGNDQAWFQRSRIRALRKSGIPVVKIIDFGLAKAFQTGTDPKSLTHDRFVGTPAFASPEQFEHSALDVRSDIYSLGETLWFALTGKTPFAGRTLSEIHHAQKSNALPVEQLKAAHVPHRLKSLLESMLALEPASRPGTRELAARLQRSSPEARSVRRTHLALASAALVVLGLSALFVFQPVRIQNADVNAAPEKSIAVLPFENLSDEKQNAFLADGVQDEILTNLAKVADLKVISRTSVMQYKSGVVRNLRDVAKELGVAHVLEGSVQRVGGRVRVSAQLIDARSDTHLWADHYDRDVSDVFAIESELAKEIVGQLRSKLSPTEKAAIEERPTADLIAYDYYARAKTVLSTAGFGVLEKEKLFDALHLLQQAIARDPTFLLAYCQLARTHDRIYILGIDHAASRLAMAESAINTAMQLRPESGEAHLALAAHLYTCLNFDGARQELEKAGNALPNEPLVFELRGYIDRRQNRWDQAIENLRRALVLDPRNFFILQQISLACEKLRRFDEMATALDQALLLVPKDPGTRAQRASVELEQRADTKPLHAVLQAIIAEDSNAMAGLADTWLYLALCERDHDAAMRALSVMTDSCRMEGIPLPRGWCEGVAARARGDLEAANAAFKSARAGIEKIVLEQPDYAEALCVLGLLDAGLGRKEDGLREGRRAVELLPVTKDAINGALVIEYLAVIYAWTGEKDRALEQLAIAARIPSNATYGDLLLHPYWDPLRGDPRFKKIVASLAPK